MKQTALLQCSVNQIERDGNGSPGIPARDTAGVSRVRLWDRHCRWMSYARQGCRRHTGGLRGPRGERGTVFCGD